MVGYAPTPVDFQSTASTKLASSPIVGVDGLEPPNSMRADLQSAAIATMRYPNGVPYYSHLIALSCYSLNPTTALN